MATLHWSEIWKQTTAALESGSLPTPLENITDIFDVSLNAGHSDLLREQTDFSPRLLSLLTEFERELQSGFPFLSVYPTDKSHLTIFTLYHKPGEFYCAGDLTTRQQHYRRVLEVARRHCPFDVVIDRLNLAPNGSVLLQGRSTRLHHIRQQLDLEAPDQERRLQKIAHVTLARLSSPVSNSEFRSLYEWVAQRAQLEEIVLTVRNPILVAISDVFGLSYHEEAMNEIQVNTTMKNSRVI